MKITLEFEHSHELINLLKSLGSNLKEDELMGSNIISYSEQLQVQLAGCSVVALGGTKDIAVPGDYGWSQSYQDVLDLRMNFENLIKD